MATPAALREDVSDVTDAAEDAFDDIVRGLSDTEAIEALRDELPGLILVYGEAAAVVAAEWYDEARLAAGVGGSFTASPFDLPRLDTETVIGWAQREATSFPAMLSLINGSTQKLVATPARLTVMRSSLADPRARGWKRSGAGSCSWCLMMIGRGAVYREETAGFQAHRSCKCVAVPAW